MAWPRFVRASAKAGLAALALTLPACGADPTDASAPPSTLPTPVVIAAVAPAVGPANGWTPVIIRGTGLRRVAKVTFGSAEGFQLRIVDDVTISVLAPPHPEGPVTIAVVDVRGIAGLGRLPFLYTRPDSTCAGCWDY